MATTSLDQHRQYSAVVDMYVKGKHSKHPITHLGPTYLELEQPNSYEGPATIVLKIGDKVIEKQVGLRSNATNRRFKWLSSLPNNNPAS
jgi:hypothetical protein